MAHQAHCAAYGAVFAVGALLFWLSESRPSLLPAWAPWDFSWPEYLAITLALLWFFRGLSLAPCEARLPVWRRVAFVLGLALIYAVLQTHFDYMAQHMFFLNRAQHVVIHHLGPMLIALGGAGEIGMNLNLYGYGGGWPMFHLALRASGQEVAVHRDAPSQFHPIHSDDIVATVPRLLDVASMPATVV